MALIKVKPVISTTQLTCGITAGSPTITSSAAFGSVVAGMRVVGPGVPFNSIVDVVASTSSLTIKNAETKDVAPALATNATAALRFGYFASAAYAAGDALGFPFQVLLGEVVRNAIVVDAAKQITSVKLYFFTRKFTETADNAEWNPSDADLANVCGYLALGASQVLPSNQLVVQDPTALPVHLGAGIPVWCQLVADSAPTFTAVDDLTVILTGE